MTITLISTKPKQRFSLCTSTLTLWSPAMFLEGCFDDLMCFAENRNPKMWMYPYCSQGMYWIWKALRGVVMASPEARTSGVKLDVAFFGWVWLIVECGNILCMRKLLHAKSYALVKNEHVEAFAYKSFYRCSYFFIYSLVCMCCS